MKIFSLLFLLLSLNCFSQDSIYIQAFPDEFYSFGNPIYAHNGNYKFEITPAYKDNKTPFGYYYIDPKPNFDYDYPVMVSSFADSLPKQYLRMINPLNHKEHYNVLYEEYAFFEGKPEQLEFLNTNKLFFDTVDLWYYNFMGNQVSAKFPAFFDMSFFITDTLTSYSSFEKLCDEQIRPVYQQKINNWLQPFYISQTEITNRKYRDFIEWVRDSIAINLLYDSLDFDEAKQFLNLPRKDQKLLNEDLKIQYKKSFGLNYNYFNETKKNDYYNTDFIPILSQMYYPQPERYYKRREFDARKFKFYQYNGELVSIYPDTTSWLPDSSSVLLDPMRCMYNWHPAYDNYPVVGLNANQMKAYCEWYQYQLNLANEDETIYYDVEIPSIFHYEMALKQCVGIPWWNSVLVHPPIPLIYYRNEEDASWHIRKVYNFSSSKNIIRSASLTKIHNWDHANTTSPIYHLLGSVAEVCSNDLSDLTMTILGGDRYLGLFDPTENQYNTLFYQRHVSAVKGYSTVGFRPIVYIKKR